MKKIILVFSILFIAFQISSTAQTKTIVKPKTVQPKLIRCHLPCDSLNSSKVSFENALAWADNLPLTVIDEKGKKYLLQSFVFSIITMSPFETKEYGTGNGGIPILARNAMKNLKQKDTVFLKDVTFLNDKKEEQPLSNIVFSIQ